jgi:hypothetical protein
MIRYEKCVYALTAFITGFSASSALHAVVPAVAITKRPALTYRPFLAYYNSADVHSDFMNACFFEPQTGQTLGAEPSAV